MVFRGCSRPVLHVVLEGLGRRAGDRGEAVQRIVAVGLGRIVESFWEGVATTDPASYSATLMMPLGMPLGGDADLKRLGLPAFVEGSDCSKGWSKVPFVKAVSWLHDWIIGSSRKGYPSEDFSGMGTVVPRQPSNVFMNSLGNVPFWGNVVVKLHTDVPDCGVDNRRNGLSAGSRSSWAVTGVAEPA